MIHTRYGSEVTVLQKPDPGQFVRVRRLPDGAVRDVHISDLREDAAGELMAAIAAAGPAPQGGFA
jgi:hypothetical protein